MSSVGTAQSYPTGKGALGASLSESSRACDQLSCTPTHILIEELSQHSSWRIKTIKHIRLKPHLAPGFSSITPLPPQFLAFSLYQWEHTRLSNFLTFTITNISTLTSLPSSSLCTKCSHKIITQCFSGAVWCIWAYLWCYVRLVCPLATSHFVSATSHSLFFHLYYTLWRCLCCQRDTLLVIQPGWQLWVKP